MFLNRLVDVCCVLQLCLATLHCVCTACRITGCYDNWLDSVIGVVMLRVRAVMLLCGIGFDMLALLDHTKRIVLHDTIVQTSLPVLAFGLACQLTCCWIYCTEGLQNTYYISASDFKCLPFLVPLQTDHCLRSASTIICNNTCPGTGLS